MTLTSFAYGTTENTESTEKGKYMGRLMTAAQAAARIAHGSRPQLLVTLAQSVPAIVRTARWSLQGAYTLGGTAYSGGLIDAPSIRLSIAPAGGIGALDGGAVRLANPGTAGALWTDILDDGSLDGATLAFGFLFITGSETAADVLPLGLGDVDAYPWGLDEVSLSWIDAALRKYRDWPAEVFDLGNAPYAVEGLLGTARPVVWGDMTGSAFVFTPPASPIWRHVHAPAIDASAQRFFVRDVGTDAGQEEIVELGNIVCQIPAASRELATAAATERTPETKTVRITSNVVHAWLRPHRINATTSGSVTNPAASPATDDVESYAEIAGGDGLVLDFPGLDGSMGAVGGTPTLVDGDVTVMIVQSSASGTGTMDVSLGLRNETTGGLDWFTGHNAQAVGGITTTMATTSIAIGLHFTAAAFDELRRLAIRIAAEEGSTIRVHRVACRVIVRSAEVLAGWEEQRVFRSQRGVIEAAGLYQDGGYLDPPGTVARTEAARNPADQVEQMLRIRTFGGGLRAPAWTDPSAVLTSAVGASATSWAITERTAAAFAVGNAVVCDREVVRITAIVPGESSPDILTVERGALGSRPTQHAVGASLYICGSGGEVDVASFRGAAGVLQHETGPDLLANGAMEEIGGTYSGGGVAPGWTESDPSSVCSPSAYFGYGGRGYNLGQSLVQVGTGVASVYQTISTVAGLWYRVGGWVRMPAGSFGGTVAIDGVVSIVAAASTSWTFWEVEFAATGSSTRIDLRSPGGTGTVVWDEVTCRRITDWCWDHVVTGGTDGKPVSMRTWLDESCKRAVLRLVDDGSGRTSARARWRNRPADALWGEETLLSEVAQDGRTWSAVPRVRVSQTARDGMYTGVEVRYGWDDRLGQYRGHTYVSCRQESTGQTIATWNSGTRLATVADASAVFPSGRYAVSTGFSAIASRVAAFSHIPARNFVTEGVKAGDWLYTIWDPIGGSGPFRVMSVVESVAAEAVTIVEEHGDVEVIDPLVRRGYMFPYLFRAGGCVFFPWPGGAGEVYVYTGSGYLDIDALNIPSAPDPAAGDVIWRVISDSDDGTGVRDQHYTLRDNRERIAMRRLATLGQARTLVVEAREVQDRETAVALRNELFDMGWRRTVVETQTSLVTIDRMPGDVVTISDDGVPGGSMRGEIVEQRISARGVINYRVVAMESD